MFMYKSYAHLRVNPIFNLAELQSANCALAQQGTKSPLTILSSPVEASRYLYLPLGKQSPQIIRTFLTRSFFPIKGFLELCFPDL